MAALASDWLRHFQLLLWNPLTKFNETCKEARFQRPIPSLCFSGLSEKQDGCPGLWLAETFSTSPLKPFNGIQRNLTRSKISTSSTKFVFSGRSEKTRRPPWQIRQKVAHFTQVHDMWPFGPLVLACDSRLRYFLALIAQWHHCVEEADPDLILMPMFDWRSIVFVVWVRHLNTLYRGRVSARPVCDIDWCRGPPSWRK